MPRKPPPDEIRLKALGVTRLRPGEATLSVRIRGKADVLEQFEALSTEQRGLVVQMGIEKLAQLALEELGLERLKNALMEVKKDGE